MTRLRLLLSMAAVAAVLALAWLALGGADTAGEVAAEPAQATPETGRALIERGRYLATVGNCAGCHTARGEPEYAGGRGIETPFGTVYAPNITPDQDTGIGAWNSDDFWRALHEGRSRGGRLLYPAFPYPNYTQVTRSDADAIFAYLRSVAPARRTNRPHTLRFPFDRQFVLAGWRALFFRAGVHRDDPGRSASWNRGAYLVRGLAHCDACHGGRNLFGATPSPGGLAGGSIPMQGWYAPSLASPGRAGADAHHADDLAALLRTGIWSRGTAMGPMAEVVLRSTRHLAEADLRAITEYLGSLTAGGDAGRAPAPSGGLGDDPPGARHGRALYEDHCADCHGKQGAGAAGIYPPLAGNPSVTLASPANAIRAVLSGGFPPGTAANPRPYGMPPFGPFLNDADMAAVVSYIRGAWGNSARAVSAGEVAVHRGTRAD